MKAKFIRKPSSIVKEVIPQDEFVIEKVVEIDKNLFKCFITNPLADYDFIKENANLMYEDEARIIHTIYVVSNGVDYGVLVNSEGSSYGRYCAYLPKVLVN